MKSSLAEKASFSFARLPGIIKTIVKTWGWDDVL